MDDDTEHRTVSDSQIDTWNQAQKNVQSDWNETNINSDSYIKHKPTIPKVTNDLTDELKSSYDDAVTNSHVHNNKTVLDNIDDQYIKKWNSAYSHSIFSHAPENAQENIIEDIKINGVSTAISDKTVNITTPTKTSDITNDSGFITNIANNLVNYYLKSEVYTKEEVQSLISRVSSLELIKVDALPTENIKTSAIYLVPSDQSEENNIYTEYIYMDGQWEIIGDTSVDLSQYALNKDVNEIRSDLSQLSKEMIDVKGATVGQIIKVSAVDDTGKPTAWEPATPPSKLTDFKNDLYFSKEELFLTLTKNDFKYDENEKWALYVSNPNITFTEDGNGFAYKVNVSIGGKTYTNSGTYSDFKMKDSDPPSINELFSTDDQSDFIETWIEMLGGYNAETDDENYSGFSIVINDGDVTWLDVDDFILELYRIKYKKIPIDTIDFGDFFDRLTYSELDVVDEIIHDERAGGYNLLPLIYVSGVGFYAAMGRYNTKGLDRIQAISQYNIDPNVVGYNFSLGVGQTYTNTTNKMRIQEAGNPSEMSASEIFSMSQKKWVRQYNIRCDRKWNKGTVCSVSVAL